MTEDLMLETFGKFIIHNLRDTSIDFCDKLLAGNWKASKLQTIQQDLHDFTPVQKELIRKSVIASIDTAIHDFLFALEENTGKAKDVKMLIYDENVLSLGVSLREQLFGENGWYQTLSRYNIQF